MSEPSDARAGAHPQPGRTAAWWGTVVASLGLVVWWLWSGPSTEVARSADAGGEPLVHGPSARVAPVGASDTRAPPTEQAHRPVQAYDQVVDACGFDVVEACVDAGCGAVVSMPDLDRYTGWAQLLMDQPGVVASTAARDLGLPVEWTPCGDALTSSPDVWSVQLDWNRELWCVGEPEACDMAAAGRYGWTGFSTGAGLTRRYFVP